MNCGAGLLGECFDHNHHRIIAFGTFGGCVHYGFHGCVNVECLDGTKYPIIKTAHGKI
jgi:hypothetical protein